MNKNFEEYLVYISGLKNYSENTLLAYKNNLCLFEKWLEENEENVFLLTGQDILSFIASLSYKNFSPATVNQILSTIRGFYDFAVRFKMCDLNPTDTVKNIKLNQNIPDFLFTDEMIAFCNSPNENQKLWEKRDKALFASLYSTGCRVSELISLNVKDLANDFTSAIVWGKGNKERKVFFAQFSVRFLKDYLIEREQILKTFQKKENALFINRRGNRLTVRGVQYIINRYAEFTGTYKRISPHTFRHSFASTLLAKGMDIRIVQELLGHASISTTQKYTHVTSEQLRNLYRDAHPHGKTK
ncbi:MAG: tyrosine-type recombinase/integrase [Spirochaetaceae bacterium]|nr:tyrosine-type recombinase/integrase [Spirochaetaceae bacterium]